MGSGHGRQGGQEVKHSTHTHQTDETGPRNYIRHFFYLHIILFHSHIHTDMERAHSWAPTHHSLRRPLRVASKILLRQKSCSSAVAFGRGKRGPLPIVYSAVITPRRLVFTIEGSRVATLSSGEQSRRLGRGDGDAEMLPLGGSPGLD